MNVREIVAAHLKAIGADGLACEDCENMLGGCGLKDLMPCYKDVSECVPAKLYAPPKTWPAFIPIEN